MSPPPVPLFFEKHYHVCVCVQSFRYEVRIPRGGELVVCKGRSTDSWKTTRARGLVFIEGSTDRWRFSFSPHGRNKFSVFKRNDHNGALVSLHVKLERTSILSRTVPGIWSALAPTFHEEIILRARAAVLPRVSNEPLQASTLDHRSVPLVDEYRNSQWMSFFLSFSLLLYHCLSFWESFFLPPLPLSPPLVLFAFSLLVVPFHERLAAKVVCVKLAMELTFCR